MAKKKRKVSKKKISIFIVILIIIVGAILAAVYLMSNKDVTTLKVKNSDTIKGYDYSLRDNATKYEKSLFKELKEVLSADDIDEDKYAELVTKLFVSDFFNLNNKVSKSDVGGTQFVYEDFRSDFDKLASSSIYKSVKSNVYGNRKQELPVVSSVSTVKNDSESFTYGDNTDDSAYSESFEITYKEDLGYQTEGTIILIHNDKKLEVASMK